MTKGMRRNLSETEPLSIIPGNEIYFNDLIHRGKKFARKKKL